jgi:hypothetical protein
LSFQEGRKFGRLFEFKKWTIEGTCNSTFEATRARGGEPRITSPLAFKFVMFLGGKRMVYDQIGK